MSAASLDLADLVRALEEHPEWRVELRRLLLPQPLLDLPQLVAEVAATRRSVAVVVQKLAESQQRAQEELAAFRRQVQEELAEVRRQTDERFAAMAEAQRRTDERLAALAEAQRRTDEQIAHLVRVQEEFSRVQEKLLQRVARLVGESVERRYRERAPAYFGRWFRGVEVLEGLALVKMLDEAVEKGQLSEEERAEVLCAEVMIRGRDREGEEVLLLVEASAVVDQTDVRRAARRARLLERVGEARVIPVVAGEELWEEVTALCQEQGGWQLVGKAPGPPPTTP